MRMNKAKTQLLLCGGAVAFAAVTVAAYGVLIDAVTWWGMHVNGMDWGHAAAQAPAVAGACLALLGIGGLALYCRWDEQQKIAAAERRRAERAARVEAAHRRRDGAAAADRKRVG